MRPKSIRPLEAFAARVMPEPNSGCWLWTGGLSAQTGYGRFYDGNGTISAHRFSYQAHVGPLVDGLVIDHKCRVRSCVNPAHLRLVTQQVNTLAGVGPGAKNAIKTPCVNGHEFTETNTQRRLTGRGCKACLLIRSRAHRSRKKANLANNAAGMRRPN